MPKKVTERESEFLEPSLNKSPEEKYEGMVEVLNEVFLFKHQYPFEKRAKWAREAF